MQKRITTINGWAVWGRTSCSKNVYQKAILNKFEIISQYSVEVLSFFLVLHNQNLYAQMVKLVDTPAWGAGAGYGVQVRVLFWALKIKLNHSKST